MADTLSRPEAGFEAGFEAWIDEALEPLEGVDHRTWSALLANGIADPRVAAVKLLDCATRHDGPRRRHASPN